MHGKAVLSLSKPTVDVLTPLVTSYRGNEKLHCGPPLPCTNSPTMVYTPLLARTVLGVTQITPVAP